LRRLLASLLTVILILSFSWSLVGAAEYPSSTIKIMVAAKAGGATDASGRIVAQFLREQLGVPVVVVNQEGGGGAVATDSTINAKPDGYTLLYDHVNAHVRYHTGLYGVSPLELTPIATTAAVNQTIATDKASPWQTLDDLVQDARANPKKYAFGMQTGASSHFLSLALMDAADIELRLLDAGFEADKLAALRGGQLNLIQATVGAAREYVEAGIMRVLAVCATERDPLAPDFPTAVEQGYDIVFQSMHTLYGPPGLPDEIVKVISDALAKLEDDPEYIEKLHKIGHVWGYRNPEDTKAFVRNEFERIGRLAEKFGLKK